MKLKNFTPGWMVIIMVLVIFSGCAKYEDGPAFSLSTKKSRLVGDWTLARYDGDKVSTPWVKSFMSDGTFKEVITIVTGNVEYEGKWEFSENKEMIYVTVQNVVIKYKIIRLTSSEFNFKDADDKLWEMTK